jgi:hypothetical protein
MLDLSPLSRLVYIFLGLGGHDGLGLALRFMNTPRHPVLDTGFGLFLRLTTPSPPDENQAPHQVRGDGVGGMVRYQPLKCRISFGSFPNALRL